MEQTEVMYGLIALLALVAGANFFLGMKMGKGSGGESESLDKMMEAQASLAGRLAQMAEAQAAQQDKLSDRLQAQERQLSKTLEDRLSDVSKRVGDGLQKSTEKNAESLQSLQERLAVIDAAQKKIQTLSEQVVSLQDVLSNKQARGAFGEIQLKDLVSAALPPSVYGFQVPLSNGKRADCVLNLPNPPGKIVIDAKFPLENYHLMRNADTEGDRTKASRAFGTDVLKHVKDISERYIVPGETAESALMFLPSEAVYAELHANFPDVLEKSYRARVWIVSPTTLMATLNTIRAVLKDARMREQAGVIQQEVGILLKDVGRLDKRVDSLSRHFDQANRDVQDIRVSSEKITRRGGRIEDLELVDGEASEEEVLAGQAQKPSLSSSFS